jgi:pimeloyl-ACP methyl ester carboxylesterase
VGELFLDTGAVRLCYEVFDDGLDADAPTVVLVMGLGLDMLWWREDFCRLLLAEGLRVVRFDNRDVGRSSRLRGPGPSSWQFLRRRAATAYTLEEMGQDTAALMSAVAPGGAHVVGVSLGSFIAQASAIAHPELVRSLVSIMGRPGDGKNGKVAASMLREFLRRPSGDQAQDLLASFERIGSSGRTAADELDVRTIVARSGQRSRDDSGSGRQLAAILMERDRTAGLATLQIPTLVVHGDRDRVVRPSGGVATAAAIPHSELLMIAGMGHDLPRRVWAQVVDGIVRTVRRAEPAWQPN